MNGVFCRNQRGFCALSIPRIACNNISKNIFQSSFVAIARKLLVVIWHVMTAAEVDRRADADRVAGKLMTWGSKLAFQRPGNLSVGQFARFHLLKLGLGDDLFYIVRGGIKRLIPSAQKLQTDHPDLFTTDQ